MLEKKTFCIPALRCIEHNCMYYLKLYPSHNVIFEKVDKVCNMLLKIRVLFAQAERVPCIYSYIRVYIYSGGSA